jgi:hypothetical protein
MSEKCRQTVRACMRSKTLDEAIRESGEDLKMKTERIPYGFAEVGCQSSILFPSKS